MSGDTEFFWKDIETRINPEPFCTSCQISSMNKNSGSKNILKPKSPFKWVFMDITPATSSKRLTSETDFSNCILILMNT